MPKQNNIPNTIKQILIQQKKNKKVGNLTEAATKLDGLTSYFGEVQYHISWKLKINWWRGGRNQPKINQKHNFVVGKYTLHKLNYKQKLSLSHLPLVDQ